MMTLGNNIITRVLAHPHGTRVRTQLSAHVVPTDVNVSPYRSLISKRIFVNRYEFFPVFSNASFKLNSPRFQEGGRYAASSPGRDAKYRDRRQCKAKAENNLMIIHISHLYTDIVECSPQVSILLTLTDHLQHVYARTTLLKCFFF